MMKDLLYTVVLVMICIRCMKKKLSLKENECVNLSDNIPSRRVMKLFRWWL